MANAITASYTQSPPMQSQMDITNPDDPASVIKVWTYGGYLFHSRYRRTDVLLRRLVAQCLCAEPAHRPRLDDLKDAIERRLADDDWAGPNTTAAVHQWAGNVLGHPPGAPVPPVPPYWVDTPAGTPLPP